MMLRIYQTASFWDGQAAARRELLARYGSEADFLAYHTAIRSHEAIATGLRAGKPLDDIPEFAEWSKTIYRKPGSAR